MTQNIIEINHVDMRFNLAEEKTDTIKEYFVKLLRGKLHFSEFYAVKDVSFNIKKGESVALIGRNGSGKKMCIRDRVEAVRSLPNGSRSGKRCRAGGNCSKNWAKA